MDNLTSFGKPEAYDQTVLPDKNWWKYQNTKIWMRHFWDIFHHCEEKVRYYIEKMTQLQGRKLDDLKRAQSVAKRT